MKAMKTMRIVMTVALLAGVLAAAGCSGTKNVANLSNFSMSFNGFTPVIGKTFYLKLVDTTNGDTLAITTPTAVTADGFSVTLPNLIQNGHNYRTDFWVDIDGDGLLDHSPNGTPAGVDNSWSVIGTGSAAGLSQTFTYNTNFVDITPF
jgi:hypothetical protein